MRQNGEVTRAMRKRGYHHGDLANALTEAATDLARGGGPEAVVLRAAARQVGVSATAAYRHFASHADLIHEVKERCQTTLAGYMDAELTREPASPDRQIEAVRRLRALGMGYLRFAVAEPGLFRTAFCHTDTAKDHNVEEWHSPAYDKLGAVLDELADVGLIDPQARQFAEVFPWAAIHGLANLLVEGPLGGLPEEFQEMAMHRVMESVIDGLSQRPWSREHPAIS